MTEVRHIVIAQGRARRPFRIGRKPEREDVPMKLDELDATLLEEVRNAKSPEEIVAICEENGLPITDEQAAACYEEIRLEKIAQEGQHN